MIASGSGTDAIQSRKKRQGMGWEGDQNQGFHCVAEFPHIAVTYSVVLFLSGQGELWSKDAVDSIERLTREEVGKVCGLE